MIFRSPTTRHQAQAWISGSVTAFSTISGPMPAGSPMGIQIRGLFICKSLLSVLIFMSVSYMMLSDGTRRILPHAVFPVSDKKHISPGEAI